MEGRVINSKKKKRNDPTVCVAGPWRMERPMKQAVTEAYQIVILDQSQRDTSLSSEVAREESITATQWWSLPTNHSATSTQNWHTRPKNHSRTIAKLQWNQSQAAS
jgi:hypothetical protein